MKKVKDKYEFILDLLETGKLTPAQKERVMLLSTNVIKDSSQKENEIIKRIEEIEAKIKGGIKPEPPITKEKDKNQLTHKPDYITKYLQKFRENNALKWTTHAWEEKIYESITDFIDELNKDKEYQEIYNYNRDLYNLLRYFLYKPKQNVDENGVPEFGWPKLNDIRIGWQYPNYLLINWCKENYDKKEIELKYPFQFVLPQELQPKKSIKRKMITTFENVVDVFKTEIQFRDNYLYLELDKKRKQTSNFTFIGIEKFEKLDFYTYTTGLLAAIDNVINEIKKRETEKNICFNYIMSEKYLIIDITHENSYPTRIINTNSLTQFMGGGIKTIAENVFSLCDFSVISKFKDQNSIEFAGELSILYEGITATVTGKNIDINDVPILKDYQNEIKGFTYRFKFYI